MSKFAWDVTVTMCGSSIVIIISYLMVSTVGGIQ